MLKFAKNIRMQYMEVRFRTAEPAERERLIALLDNDMVTGFEETETEIIAYYKDGADLQQAGNIAGELDIAYNTAIIGEKNWNEEWERNFEPIMLDDYCYIRADFHPERPGIKHEIIITPKMSFGTGHHATTMQMIELMRELDLDGKAVLDFGTGTGILAILAYKCGAAHVTGIDNDVWAYKNAVENCERNDAAAIRICQASIEDIRDEETFDVILANINRHILLDTMPMMFSRLHNGGDLLLSGILENEDVAIVRSCAEKNGFTFKALTGRNKWAAMHFRKQL